MVKSRSLTWFQSHFFMFLWWIIEKNAPGVGFWLVFIGPGGGGLNSFLSRGWGIRPSKKLLGGFVRGDGKAWYWLIHYLLISVAEFVSFMVQRLAAFSKGFSQDELEFCKILNWVTEAFRAWKCFWMNKSFKPVHNFAIFGSSKKFQTLRTQTYHISFWSGWSGDSKYIICFAKCPNFAKIKAIMYFAKFLNAFLKPRNLNFLRNKLYIWNFQTTRFKMIYDMFVF